MKDEKLARAEHLGAPGARPTETAGKTSAVQRRYSGTSGQRPAQLQRKAGGSPGKGNAAQRRYGGIVQRAAAASTATHDTSADSAQEIAAATTDGASAASAGLPAQAQIQSSFGAHDISNVKVHQGDDAMAANAALGSRAFATGDHIVLGSGTDLHTQAHEAAHVVQQRAGVQLKAGVGQVGDRYESHADQVAETVVRGESAEPLLESMAGPSSSGASAGAAVQLASDYDSRMPSHDVYGDSYQYNDKSETKFTYHHIIPENKLETAVGQIKAIQALLAEDSGEVDAAADAVLQKGEAQWLEVRVKNLTHEVNVCLSGGAKVNEGEIRVLVTAHNTLGALFPAVLALVERKIRAALPGKKQTLKGKIDGKLAKGAGRALKKDGADVPSLVDTHFTGVLNASKGDDYGVPLLAKQSLITILAGSKPGSWRNKIHEAIEAKTFEAYMGENFSRLREDSVVDGTLKRVVREAGLPADLELTDAVQWNPGNIHRGPSSGRRMNPDINGFNELLDDGGDGFEKAAANVVTPEHFAMLEALNARLDALNALDLTAEDLDLEDAAAKAKDALERMAAIYDQGTTGFDAGQWSQVAGPDKNYMRLNQNDENLRETGLID